MEAPERLVGLGLPEYGFDFDSPSLAEHFPVFREQSGMGLVAQPPQFLVSLDGPVSL